MRQIITWLSKAMVAFFLAFLIISVFCFFYYNLPVHYPVTSGATDFCWNPYHVSFRGTEGFSYTKTDGNGYVNTFPHSKTTIDILVMGSSHTEGFNVNSDENFTYLLNQKLHDDHMQMYAYSIGMSGHAMVRCFNHLENAIASFQPSGYVVLETHDISPSLESLKQLDSGIFPVEKSYDSGILYQLQKLDFLRLAYAQLSNALKQGEKVQQAGATEVVDNRDYALFLEKMLRNGSEIAKEYGVELVIVYAPRLEIDYYGDVCMPKNSEDIALFESLCQKYGVHFINMQEPFEQMYYETNRLPHGFSNTAVGQGHLNKYGHACFAQEIYDYVTRGNDQ